METGTTQKVGLSHHTIHTDIEIDAPIDVVWSVLTDTPSYQEWAAFMVDIKNQIEDGSQITVSFQLNPAKNKLTIIDHTITVEDGVEFYWAEKAPGGFRDNHRFRVEPIEGGRTRFVQSDELKGGIVLVMGGRLARMLVKGYQAFNRSLKAEAERRAKSA